MNDEVMATLVIIALVAVGILYYIVWPKLKARMIDGAGRALQRKKYESVDDLLKYGNRVFRSAVITPEQIQEATRYAASAVGDVLIEDNGENWYMKIGKKFLIGSSADRAALAAHLPTARDGDNPIIASMTIDDFKMPAGSPGTSLLKVGSMWELIEERLRALDPALTVERGETNLKIHFN